MKYITKDQPIVSQNGYITSNISIRDNTLLIDGKLKYYNDKWYMLGDDQKWYFLGFGANPAYTISGDSVLNHELLQNVFEEIEE